jgi:outer membrane protein TolC
MAGLRRSPRSLLSPSLRRWAAGLCTVGLPLLAAGCADRAATQIERGPLPDNPAAVSAIPPYLRSDAAIRRVSYEPSPPDALPAPAQLPAPAPTPVPAPTPTATPVNLDSVFRLAEEHNPQIALAREKVNESQIENQLAAKGWLPKVTAGVGYYRHEGGIQNEDGTLTRSSFGALWPNVDLHTEFDVREATFHRIDAERKRWQQQGELSKVSNEQLLDAAQTYIDLLTARRSEAVAKELEKYQRDVLMRAKDLAKEGGQLLVETAEAELNGTQAAESRMRQQGDAAAAKLAYLLGLDPLSDLVPVDEALAPIHVVDASPATADLVARALTDGPGVNELQQMLAVIDSGMAELQGPKKYLPTIGLCVGEGMFEAGTNSTLGGSNRLDVGVQARWDLTEVFRARDEKQLAESRRRQVALSYDDLRSKLTLGVREARGAILSGRVQMDKAAEQVKRASESYRLADLRLKQNAPGSSPAEVLQSLRGLEQAHYNYITSVSAYNKAQIRLLLLLGPVEACAAPAAK